MGVGSEGEGEEGGEVVGGTGARARRGTDQTSPVTGRTRMRTSTEGGRIQKKKRRKKKTRCVPLACFLVSALYVYKSIQTIISSFIHLLGLRPTRQYIGVKASSFPPAIRPIAPCCSTLLTLQVPLGASLSDSNTQHSPWVTLAPTGELLIELRASSDEK